MFVGASLGKLFQSQIGISWCLTACSRSETKNKTIKALFGRVKKRVDESVQHIEIEIIKPCYFNQEKKSMEICNTLVGNHLSSFRQESRMTTIHGRHLQENMQKDVGVREEN